MFRIKRLYLFVLQTFLPLFIMTFFICLFIVLMQFLWRYIDELVGKGLDVAVIGELFFYAALTMVPLALPLAILLASLMAFGNLGEHLELTAMKSAGVSLIKVMSPLIIFLSFVSIGAFFFQNDVLPKAQVKMWSLLFSMRQKSPELDIPEGAFYDQIEGYNLYVKQKDRETGMLYGMMIYDVSSGNGSANIIVSDSGKLSMTTDRKHLVLQLFSGESFEDLKDNRSSVSRRNAGMLYRRESFKTKEILIPFDATFNRMGDESMSNQYIGKNFTELNHAIDSLTTRADSIGDGLANRLLEEPLCGVAQRKISYKNEKRVSEPIPPVVVTKAIDVDSMINSMSVNDKRNVVELARNKAERLKQDMQFKGYALEDNLAIMRRHEIELQKKFTLSFACLIFFFIGAPLGAIIRKGGLGVPIVISVFLFIVYYIIDNTGYKLARDGHWAVWEGIWLSSEVLLPLGIFLTYKAVNDSAVFNPDAYINFFKRITGQQQVRHIQLKDIVMDDVVPEVAVAKLQQLKADCEQFLTTYRKPQSYMAYWTRGFDRDETKRLSAEVEKTVTYLENSTQVLVVNKLMDMPILRQLFTYCPSRGNKKIGIAAICLFPIGLAGYFIGSMHQKHFKRDIKLVIKVSDELTALIKDSKDAIEDKSKD